MKTYFVLLLGITAFAFGELVNINPDPDGEPWWAGGVSEPSPELFKKIEALPELKMPDSYRYRKDPLPSSVDNSALQYFRPVFNQADGSCSQASGIGYNFTYEMNFMRGTSAAVTANQFPSHHTYNFLNEGSGVNGSWYFDGWDIIKENGCPDVDTYGGMWPSTYRDSKWLDGYDLYESGMNNRVSYQFVIPVGTPEGLETLKQYFIDYCDGSPTGGIVNFTAGIGGTYLIGRLAAGTPHANEYAIRKWHTELNHSMTFVGYDDSVRWDMNNDGRFTNDTDINGDSIVDMKDWEIGALLMVNSYGENWPNTGMGGRCWVMYRTLAMDISEGGIWNNSVHTMRTKASFEPSLKLKASVSHDNRSKIKIYAGISSDTLSAVPEHTLSFPLFLYQGGDYGMRADVNTIELGLDITSLLTYAVPNSPAKIFFSIDENDPDDIYPGYINYFSVLDRDSNETVSAQSNVNIVNNSTTYLTIILSPDFQQPAITTSSLPYAVRNTTYSKTFTATGGSAPYIWNINIEYDETVNPESFPQLADTLLSVTNDDDGFGILELDFPFPFYGTLYDRITLSTDGSILFKDEFENVRSEGGIIKTKAISPFAADLMAYPADGDGIFYYQNSSFAEIRWITSMYDMPEVNLDFAVRLYPDGNIRFFYGTGLTTGIIWASGISGGNSNTSLISSISNAYDPSGLKTAFGTGEFPYGMTISADGVFSGTPDLPPDVWNISFRVTDDNNISSIAVLPFTIVDGLGIPLNVVLAAGSSPAVLTWSPVEGASLYNIYRSPDPYGTFTRIATVPETTFEDSETSGSAKYFYYITADNSKR